MNLAILGAGLIAVTMADTINKLNESGNKDVHLYAAASRSIDKAREFAEKNNVEKAYGSYEEMLDDPNVDLVYIAVPHSLHHDTALLCLEHGKNVLCEKAFTVNVHEAEDLIRKAEEKNLLITEAIWTRYQPMRKIINEQLSSGIIGKPKMISANLAYNITWKKRITDPSLAGGALLDVGVYTLNFAEMIFGRADGVQAHCVKSDEGVDLSESVILTWNDGRMASLNAGVTSVSDRYGIIYGEKGFAVVENINNPQSISFYDEEYRLIKKTDCPPQLTGYEYEVLEAAKCIREGLTECPSMPHSETLHVMELMDHIRAQMGIKYPFE